ncbi:co-chaperone DjlA [Aurantivibrio infirmus]
MILGKLIGGILGYLIYGPITAIVGLFVGHMFDKGYALIKMGGAPVQQVQKQFFESVFILIGYLAKADGRVSEAEVKQTEHFMEQMRLNAEHKREAIRLFKLGAEPNFNPDEVIQKFRLSCGRFPNLVQLLLVHLINVALADGRFDPAEESVLKKVAQGLGLSQAAFEQMLRMIKAQDAFGGAGYDSGSFGSGASQAKAVDLAYQALGVSESASDSEIKKAYRKLMSQYHPDKLMGQGVPDDMIQAATERSQEIQRAYDLIKKSRA